MFDNIIQIDKQLTLALNGSHSSIMDNIMLIITSTATWIPLGLIILYCIYRNYGRRAFFIILLGILICVGLADFITSGIIKPLVERFRPTQEPTLLGLVDIVNGYTGGRYGFCSSHAANTMSVAVFLASIFRNRIHTTILIVWSLLNCWSRIYLGVHYLGDIIVGLIIGAAIGYLIYRITRKYLSIQEIHLNSSLTYAALATFVCILLLAPYTTA